MTLELDVNTWAAEQFGDCNLGDRRRTARAVKIASQFAANPSGSTPEQTERWADCKAAYRLFDTEEATFSALATPHWQHTKARTSGHYLLLGDTTLITFDDSRQIEGMGILTNGGQGYLLHSALMVDAENEDIIGLAGQTIHYRQRIPKKESHRERLQRRRESNVWGEVIDAVGSPEDNVRFTHVFDRGGDNFDVYCRLLLQRANWVVRAAQLRRLVVVAGETAQLGQHLESVPSCGTYQLALPANTNQRPRTAQVEVRFSTVGVPVPRDCGTFARECEIRHIAMHVVEVREAKPPRGVQPLRWVLLTSHAVRSFADAWRVIGYYEKRPLVEEFHKALKTGCRIESRLYETASRWEALTAVLSIVAVRLLQLKSVARCEPDRPAAELVPATWIKMLSCVGTGKHHRIETVREFMRALASLGGHLGRKHDGEPGWITIWRGFNKLHLLLRGASAIKQKCG